MGEGRGERGRNGNTTTCPCDHIAALKKKHVCHLTIKAFIIRGAAVVSGWGTEWWGAVSRGTAQCIQHSVSEAQIKRHGFNLQRLRRLLPLIVVQL